MLGQMIREDKPVIMVMAGDGRVNGVVEYNTKDTSGKIIRKQLELSSMGHESDYRSIQSQQND